MSSNGQGNATVASSGTPVEAQRNIVVAADEVQLIKSSGRILRSGLDLGAFNSLQLASRSGHGDFGKTQYLTLGLGSDER